MSVSFRKKRAPVFKWPGDLERRFADALQQYPLLWDTGDPHYCNRQQRKVAFDSLGRLLNMSGKEAFLRLKSLRTSFTRGLNRKSKSGSEDDDKLHTEREKRLLQLLQFLVPHVRTPPTISSFPAPSSTSASNTTSCHSPQPGCSGLQESEVTGVSEAFEEEDEDYGYDECTARRKRVKRVTSSKKVIPRKRRAPTSSPLLSSILRKMPEMRTRSIDRNLARQETQREGVYYEVPAVHPPNLDKVRSISKDLGYDMSEEELLKYTQIIGRMAEPYNKIYRMVEPKPPVKYGRTPGVKPRAEENEYNAWYVKTDILGASEGKLFGKKLAVKDSICIAGVQMMNGSKIMEGYVPEFDATVVHRVLEAGGCISGKAACENLSMSSLSYTNDVAPVYNPLDVTRTTGGSSSGCAALLSSGAVDLAIGGDQGGSIRMPASCCGIVGLKPTYGLVPYTGAMSLERTVDALGPMAKNVTDCALLLEVLAGFDGMDSRQPELYPLIPEYSQLLNKDILSGLKIGMLREGFHNCQPGVATAVNKAIEDFQRLGASVNEISVPMHTYGADFWRIIVMEGGYESMINGGGCGPSAKGFHSVTMMEHFKGGLEKKTQHHPTTLKLLSIFGAFMKEENNHQYYCRVSNLIMELTEAYNKALEICDVVVMPTIPIIAPKLPVNAADVQRCEMESFFMIQNTSPFNLTGHPAITVNCGEADGMPVGIMIVGNKWREQVILDVAYAYEQHQENGDFLLPLVKKENECS